MLSLCSQVNQLIHERTDVHSTLLPKQQQGRSNVRLCQKNRSNCSILHVASIITLLESVGVMYVRIIIMHALRFVYVTK